MGYTRPRITYYQGIPEGEWSMPTCGACRRQIAVTERYAGVLYADNGPRREVRHATEECLRYTYNSARHLVPGAVVRTFRYALTEWGGQLIGRITERTEEFNAYGWRAYMIEPEDPSDTSAIDQMRTHREASFREMAKTLVIDPEPRKVFISDDEWLHYVLPG